MLVAAGESALAAAERGTHRIRAVLLLLPLVAEPHPHLFGKEIQAGGDGLDELAVWTRVLLKELLESGARMWREDGTLLALARGDSGAERRAGGDGGRILRVHQPPLQHDLDRSGVCRTQLHLFEAADGALGEVAVSLVRERLTDGTLGVAEPNPLGLELLGKHFELVEEGSHFGQRDRGEGSRW